MNAKERSYSRTSKETCTWSPRNHQNHRPDPTGREQCCQSPTTHHKLHQQMSTMPEKQAWKTQAIWRRTPEHDTERPVGRCVNGLHHKATQVQRPSHRNHLQLNYGDCGQIHKIPNSGTIQGNPHSRAVGTPPTGQIGQGPRSSNHGYY